MAKNVGTFIIDTTVSEEDRTKIVDRVLSDLTTMKDELAERAPILNKRQDFFEGRHHKWTNVQGERIKQQEGHILVVVNYIYRFVQKVSQALTNSAPRIKIKPRDESNEIETSRAEAVEQAIKTVLDDNKFFEVIFKRCGINQLRDGDFAFKCVVMKDVNGARIEIIPAEDLLKLMVFWDDAAGSSYSAVAFQDMWTLQKIKREFNFDATPYAESVGDANLQQGGGNHYNDQYGMFAQDSTSGVSSVPTGKNKLPKGEIVDYWGYEVINGELKVVNIIFINREMKQFVVTDYEKINWFIGHSFASPGKPWSIGFIDPLIDPQIELNDRSGEEGDLIRVGSHMKFVAINMPDFDADSIKPGSGQVIFIEGENADFRPLQMTITPFPSKEYLEAMKQHLFNLGIPQIALAAGTAPYTGRVAATQYQPMVDLVTELRIQWEIPMRDLIRMIQQYFIDYFPEMAPIMREHIIDPVTNEETEGDLVIRDVQFDWDNILPLSRSDKVVDASTMRDRGTISLSTYLEQAGFANPAEEIKKLKKESKDPELMTIRQQFSQFSPGVVKAQMDAQRAQQEAAAQGMEEQAANQAATIPEPQAPPPPLLTPEQNGRRGIPSSGGTPTGQTASLTGSVAQTTQNINAKAGV